MSVAAMFGPHPGDDVRDLEFKLGMLNAFGTEGVDTPENRDRVVGLLRHKLYQLQPAGAEFATPVTKPTHSRGYTSADHFPYVRDSQRPKTP